MTVPLSKLGDGDFAKAQRHLARRDPVLKQLIRRVGPCTLCPNPANRFSLLAQSIIAQQISSKAAMSIRARLDQALAPEGVTPANILRTPDTTLRSAGVSEAKTRYLRDLADKVHNATLLLDVLHEFSDEEVIAQLLPVKGIGRWTAQMFLIFSLGRPDVLPVDDLGLRMAVQQEFNLAELPNRTQLEKLAELWRPYRSVATWYMWRSRGAVPQSEDRKKR
jgi:DNA-3-methyladenine glycosylase II